MVYNPFLQEKTITSPVTYNFITYVSFWGVSLIVLPLSISFHFTFIQYSREHLAKNFCFLNVIINLSFTFCYKHYFKHNEVFISDVRFSRRAQSTLQTMHDVQICSDVVRSRSVWSALQVSAPYRESFILFHIGQRQTSDYFVSEHENSN